MSKIKISATQIENVENLALYAKRFDTEELYDTDAGIEAENDLFEAVSKLLEGETFERLALYCLKATMNERIDAAVHCVYLEQDA